jgi:NTP pyrophosphatase (non-canonical NTP hydrolase)
MTLKEYQSLALLTACKHSPFEKGLGSWILGLASEVGEIADLAHKIMGHSYPLNDKTRRKLRKALGDVLWYVAVTANHLGTDLEEIARENLAKLQERYPKGFDPQTVLLDFKDEE